MNIPEYQTTVMVTKGGYDILGFENLRSLAVEQLWRVLGERGYAPAEGAVTTHIAEGNAFGERYVSMSAKSQTAVSWRAA